ncbi:MAG: winged helix-turn-helix domain-containing protein, partial [Acidobacteria bacterium]|nr:winged helix-turn-helix domain-containing protein [Acidobacteriota bacterium]
MALAVRLREDYDAGHLRALAKASRDANQTRRLLALAAIYEGSSRGEAARIGGVGIQAFDKLRSADWVLAFNAAGPEGLIDGKAPGKVPLLNAEQRAALRRIVEAGPNPAVDGVVRWRLIDLAQWVYAEFGISISKQTLSRILRGLGYRKLTARPRHPAQGGRQVGHLAGPHPAWLRSTAPAPRCDGAADRAARHPRRLVSPVASGQPRRQHLGRCRRSGALRQAQERRPLAGPA